MKKSARKKPTPPPEQNDLAFPPPYPAQAKYLALADQFLSSSASLQDAESKVVSIESGKAFNKRKHKNQKRVA
jgi:hypothetical protein